MAKKAIDTIYQKNQIINKIIDAILENENFLIIGHKNPDEDCIASTVAMGLLLSKFNKNIFIYRGYPVHDHFQYLMKISRYNLITLLGKNDPPPDEIDIVIACDTPKPDMLDVSPAVEKIITCDDIIKIEIDHHLGADSAYFASPDMSLVTEASSASELVGYLALKLRRRDAILEDHNIEEILTRNLVLAILTGIIGDSKMGNFLKSKREKRYYQIFSSLYNSILASETVKETNLANMQEVFTEIQKLSRDEKECTQIFLDKAAITSYFGHVVMLAEEMDLLFETYDNDTIVSISRGVTDLLAEKSGYIGFVTYYDHTERSDLVHFRMRRSKKFKGFDLREVLTLFDISNGGGHEGAIAFRIPRQEIDDITSFTGKIMDRVSEIVAALV